MSRGGKRPNAGRPKGTGPHQETTKAMRIPMSLLPTIQRLLSKQQGSALPLFGSKVQAGFPSPADDFQEGTLDLNEYLIKHPASTFFVRVAGDSMINAGIHPNDILIVDKSMTVSSGKIVIAVVNGEFTVKRYVKKQGKIFLEPENANFKSLEITTESEAQIWGVVTNVIHAL
jgi:DNA polymerase V